MTAAALSSARQDAPARAPSLDVLRGLAVGLVLVAHASRLSVADSRRAVWSPLEAMLGQAGVTLFFVLSGYLVGGMWVGRNAQPPRLRSYGVRRLLRIWPAYALAYVATVALTQPPDLGGLGQWAAHLLLLNSWIPGEYVAVFPVGWTLAVEATFYLVAPLLPRSARPLVLLWLGSALLAVIGGLVAPASSDPAGWVGPLRYSLPALFGLFCPGLLIAMRPAWLDRFRHRCGLLVTVFSASLMLAVAFGLQRAVWLRDLQYQAFAIAFGALLLLALQAPRIGARVLRPLAAFGVISYGVYLWHNTLMTVLLRAGFRAPSGSWVAASAILTVVTIPVAALSWVTIERPALALASRWTRPGTVPRHPAPRRMGRVVAKESP